MGILIKDPATDKAIRKLAKLKGTSLTEAVRTAVDTALAQGRKNTLWDRLNDLTARVTARGRTGLKADKAFYDSLNDED